MLNRWLKGEPRTIPEEVQQLQKRQEAAIRRMYALEARMIMRQKGATDGKC